MRAVLYIDDDKEHRFIFSECLKSIRPEMHCLMAESAEEAVIILESSGTTPVRIFIDMNMPRTDGLKTLALIKSRPELSIVPTYIFSSSERSSYASQALQMGAQAYLIKPFGFDEFCYMLDQYIPENNEHRSAQ
jgi:CheY-like chemotaxis protein